MSFDINIPIKEKIRNDNFRKGRLILSEKSLKIYIGKPKLMSNEVPSTSRWYWFGVDSLSSLHLFDDGKILMKNYHLQIKLKKPFSSGKDTLILYTSKSEGEGFINNYNNLQSMRRREEKEENEWSRNLEIHVLHKFKSSGQVDINQFAKDRLDTISECVKPSLKREMFEDGFDSRKAALYIIVCLENYINEGKLTGVIDEEKMVYTDRDFIIKQQKVVNLNVGMDFNSLLQQLGNKGINLTNIQCPQCQATCTLPSEGTSLQCESCDATIEVTDIFEKFKSFLT